MFNSHINETPAGSFFSERRERKSKGEREGNEGDSQWRVGGGGGSLGVMGEENEGDVQVRVRGMKRKGGKLGYFPREG